MKRHLFLAAMMIALVLVAKPVLAGGDKNRGDVGQGDVEQHQVEWDEYASQRLVQNQELVLTQNQEQLKVRAQVHVQWQNSRLADLWF
jgi:hypothetical protein